MLRLVRWASTRVDLGDVAKAFAPELQKIERHATLANQTTWQDLHALKDVEPMMSTLRFLMKNNAVPHSAALACTRALARSAKDAPLLLRRLLDDHRAQVKTETYTAIAQYCDEIAEGVLAGKVPQHIGAMGTLLNAYEMVDPVKGAAFYLEANLTKAGGSAIPCLVKARAPLAEIERAYYNTPNKVPRVRSAMLWAYLKYDQVDAALELEEQLAAEKDVPLSVLQFVAGAFIGDAPLDVARTHFWATEVLPHHSAVCRLLSAAWAANGSVSEQLAIFEHYLELAQGHSEATIKPVVYKVTDHIVQPSTKRETLKLRTMTDDVKALVGVYSKQPSQALFLNILLTQLSKYWPDKEALIMPILNAFSADTSDKITLRVRLNALAKISPPQKDKIVRSLWKARCGLREHIELHDWLALYRASPQTALKIFRESSPKQQAAARQITVAGGLKPFAI